MKKYIIQILPVLSILAMFQSQIDLGKSLTAIINYYEEFRNFIFMPLLEIGIVIPEITMNLCILLVTVSLAFGIHSDNKNSIAVKGLIEGIAGGLLGFLIIYININFLGSEDLIRKMDEIGFVHLQFYQIIMVIIVYCLYFLVLFFFGNFQFWVIALLFPFLIPIFYRVPFITIIGFIYSIIAIENHKFFKKIVPSFYRKKYMVNYNVEDAIENYKSLWTIKEYVNYYSPLKDLLIILLVILLIFKIIIENIA